MPCSKLIQNNYYSYHKNAWNSFIAYKYNSGLSHAPTFTPPSAIECDQINMMDINIIYSNLTLQVAALQSDTPTFFYFFEHPNTLV